MGKGTMKVARTGIDTKNPPYLGQNIERVGHLEFPLHILSDVILVRDSIEVTQNGGNRPCTP